MCMAPQLSQQLHRLDEVAYPPPKAACCGEAKSMGEEEVRS